MGEELRGRYGDRIAALQSFVQGLGDLHVLAPASRVRGAADRRDLEPVEAHAVLSELEEWSAVLKAQPEVIHKIRDLSAGTGEAPEACGTPASGKAGRKPRRPDPLL